MCWHQPEFKKRLSIQKNIDHNLSIPFFLAAAHPAHCFYLVGTSPPIIRSELKKNRDPYTLCKRRNTATIQHLPPVGKQKTTPVTVRISTSSSMGQPTPANATQRSRAVAFERARFRVASVDTQSSRIDSFSLFMLTHIDILGVVAAIVAVFRFFLFSKPRH